MLLNVESLHQVRCNMVFGYKKYLSMLPFVEDFGLSINTQNYLYELDFLMMSYFSDTFKIFFTVDENGASTSIKSYWNQLFCSGLGEHRKCSKCEKINPDKTSKHRCFSI